MLSGLKKYSLFFAGILLLTGFLLLSKTVGAATSTIRGKAYWGDYGYIYFHCIDDVIGNRLDEVENLAGAGKYRPPEQSLFHFYSAPCTDLVHGVEINENGWLSGSAWNPSVGLINFFGTDAPNFGFNSSKCDDSCTGGASNCIACYDFENQALEGYAQIASTGHFIALSGKSGSLVNVYTKAETPVYPGADNIILGDFAGVAKMDDDLSPYPSDIHFNCETEGYPLSDTCATRSYKVYIGDLILGRLSAPNWTYANACAGDALKAVLRWDKLAGIQSGFEIIVNDTNVMSTTTGEYVCWSGKKGLDLPETYQYIISNSNPDCPSGLDYDTPYYWWLRGYDQTGKPTEWIQYDTNSFTDNGGDPDFNPLTFHTYKNEFPSPFFSWFPFEVTTASTTTFTSNSLAFDAANPDVAINCNDTLCPGYLWTTSDIDATIYSATSSVTNIDFFTATGTTVTLRVTDYSGYYCSTSTLLRINYDLPLWREVKAE